MYEESPTSPPTAVAAGRAAVDDDDDDDDGAASESPALLLIKQPPAASMATLVAESNTQPLSPWIKEHGTSANQLLHHFSNNSAVIMGASMNPVFWDLACRNNFLVSTMLAVSACHLRHYTPNPGRHRIAELGQESAAITALKSALAQPLQSERADALLCAAVMLNAVTFAFVESHALSTSWVFSSNPDRLGWLDLLLRFKKLEQATSQFRASSFLQPLLDAGDDPVEEDAELDGVPPAWKRLAEGGHVQSRPLYRKAVRTLGELRSMEPDCPGSFAYIGFTGKLEDGFRDLLFRRDPRALWIFGYWLGLLGRLNIWWCSRRVGRDCAAVRCFLEERRLAHCPGDEGRMWQALIDDLSTASAWPPPHPERV